MQRFVKIISLNKGKTIHTILGREFEGGVKTRGNFALKMEQLFNRGPMNHIAHRTKILVSLDCDKQVHISQNSYPCFCTLLAKISNVGSRARNYTILRKMLMFAWILCVFCHDFLLNCMMYLIFMKFNSYFCQHLTLVIG